jgi:hypothetical protein
MPLMKKYAALYGDLEFTPEEQEELGRLAARLIKIASDGCKESDLTRFFVDEFKGIDEETYDRLNGTFEFLSLYEKTAGSLQTLGLLLAPIATAIAATPLIAHGIQYLQEGGAIKQSLATIMRNHPDLKGDPNVPMYFQAIVDFAPAVAKNPLIAGNLLSQWHKAGPSLATPQIMRELVGIQKDIPSKIPDAAGAAAPSIMEMAKLYGRKDDADKKR